MEQAVSAHMEHLAERSRFRGSFFFFFRFLRCPSTAGRAWFDAPCRCEASRALQSGGFDGPAFSVLGCVLRGAFRCVGAAMKNGRLSSPAKGASFASFPEMYGGGPCLQRGHLCFVAAGTYR